MHLIIQSANDVAAQIAEHIGGTEQAFIDMMNQRASEIGCTNTRFCKFQRLPDDNHYSSARDMALIFREGLKMKHSVRLWGTLTISFSLQICDSQQSDPAYPSSYVFAPESGFYYEGCIMKTGTTLRQAYTCHRSDQTIPHIAVTMRGTELSNSCIDSTAMFNYAFENFTKTEVNGGYSSKRVELNFPYREVSNTNGNRNRLLFRRLSDQYRRSVQATDTPYRNRPLRQRTARKDESPSGSFYRNSRGR